MDIRNQVAMVTGAGSGMGEETARSLAAEGAHVVVIDRNITAAEKVAEEIAGLAIQCDVTNSQQVEDTINKVKQQLGDIRVCVNCAGIATAHTIIAKDSSAMELAEFAQIIQVNLIGTFNVLRVVAAHMAKLEPVNDSQERGVIINTASIAAFEGQIGQIAYAASKSGVVGMTLPAARELARYGIRVLAIARGLIATPMLASLPDNVRDNLAATIPFPKRFGKPTEFAKLVLHIVDNIMLNGEVIRLDGALRMAAK